MVPNYMHIVQEVADTYPTDFRNCHKPELGDAAFTFIKRVAWKLFNIDARFGLNGKRGTDELSMDALSFKDDNGTLAVIDVVAGAGGSNPQVAWQNVGGVSKWIQPEPMDGTPTNPTTPTNPGIDITALMTKLNGIEYKLNNLSNDMVSLKMQISEAKDFAATAAVNSNLAKRAVENFAARAGELTLSVHAAVQSQAEAVINALRN